MTKINYIQIHIGDLVKDTSELDNEEFGAYMRLLLAHYSKYHDGIPIDKVTKIVRENVPEVMDQIEEFFIVKNDKLLSKRCVKEIKKIKEKSSKASKSAKERWEKQRVNDDANAMRTHSDGNANQEPITSNQEPVKEEGSKEKTYKKEFIDFYSQYPRKVSKMKAEEKYIIARKSGTSHEDIMSGLMKYSYSVTNTLPKHIAHPSTWLHQRRWDDEDFINPNQIEETNNGKPTYNSVGQSITDKRDQRSGQQQADTINYDGLSDAKEIQHDS